MPTLMLMLDADAKDVMLMRTGVSARDVVSVRPQARRALRCAEVACVC